MANRKMCDPKGDVHYYVPKRKKPIAYSTKAVNDFLVIVHEMNPTATIQKLHDILMDRTQWIFNPEAVAVVEAHIKAGYGDSIPDWR